MSFFREQTFLSTHGPVCNHSIFLSDYLYVLIICVTFFHILCLNYLLNIVNYQIIKITIGQRKNYLPQKICKHYESQILCYLFQFNRLLRTFGFSEDFSILKEEEMLT